MFYDSVYLAGWCIDEFWVMGHDYVPMVFGKKLSLWTQMSSSAGQAGGLN